MTTSNKRECDRKNSLNLLDYVLVNDAGEPVSRAMARTINVSLKGILLETYEKLEKGQRLIVTIGLEEDIIELNGRISHIEETPPDDETFREGVEFIGVNKADLAVLQRYLDAFNNSET